MNNRELDAVVSYLNEDTDSTQLLFETTSCEIDNFTAIMESYSNELIITEGVNFAKVKAKVKEFVAKAIEAMNRFIDNFRIFFQRVKAIGLTGKLKAQVLVMYAASKKVDLSDTTITELMNNIKPDSTVKVCDGVDKLTNKTLALYNSDSMYFRSMETCNAIVANSTQVQRFDYTINDAETCLNTMNNALDSDTFNNIKAEKKPHKDAPNVTEFLKVSTILVTLIKKSIDSMYDMKKYVKQIESAQASIQKVCDDFKKEEGITQDDSRFEKPNACIARYNQLIKIASKGVSTYSKLYSRVSNISKTVYDCYLYNCKVGIRDMAAAKAS